MARHGVAISREVDNHWGFTNNAYIVAHGLLDQGAFEEALALAEESVARAEGGHPPTYVFNLIALGDAHRILYNLEPAIELHQRARAIGEMLRQPLLTEWANAHLAADYALAGDWDEAYAAATRALALSLIKRN